MIFHNLKNFQPGQEAGLIVKSEEQSSFSVQYAGNLPETKNRIPAGISRNTIGYGV